MISTLSHSIVHGAYEAMSESKENLTIRVYSRFNDYEIFRCITIRATYREGKIITLNTDGRELDYSPVEGYDWNWEDYESSKPASDRSWSLFVLTKKMRDFI